MPKRTAKTMIRKQILPNGITLLTEAMPQVRSVSLGVWLRRGSRHEPASLNGVSHFIEHLVFKGTQTRTAREIALTVDSIGGQMDAFTSKEYTCFYAKVLDEHLPAAVDLVSDIVLRPLFDAAELERERKVICEEIRMVEDTAEELVYDLFSSHAYPAHPLGRPIQGTERTVGRMSRARVYDFFRGAYLPSNVLIVAAGNLEHRAVASSIARAFGSMEPRREAPRAPQPVPRMRGGIVLREKRQLEQMHLLFGLPAFPESFAGRYPMFVLNAILGGTMSSRLFQKIREERGLAYSVYSAVNAFQDTGLMMVYAATGPRTAGQVAELILAELADLRDRAPSDDEVRVAKEHLKGSLMLSLESTGSRMSNLARQEIYHGRQFGLDEILRSIASVTPDTIHAVARRLFAGARPALAAVGRTAPLKLKPSALRL
jgi:predicted Zn-dependent peptidase